MEVKRKGIASLLSTAPHLPLLSVQVRVGRGFPERPVPQTRVADSPSTTATVSDPGPENLAPAVCVSTMLFPHDRNSEKTFIIVKSQQKYSLISFLLFHLCSSCNACTQHFACSTIFLHPLHELTYPTHILVYKLLPVTTLEVLVQGRVVLTVRY